MCNGIQNLHNQHEWAYANLHATVETSHQQRFSNNIWARISGDCLIGPNVLPYRLNGETYRQFLQRSLPPLLEDLPLAVQQVMYFMHDGAVVLSVNT